MQKNLTGSKERGMRVELLAAIVTSWHMTWLGLGLGLGLGFGFGLG